MPADDAVTAWIDALQVRHRAALTSREFLKCVRALSARYVERRHELPERSPIDSAGKRAAFAAFYAPLHFLTLSAIVERTRLPATTALWDLGCGTGVGGAAWAHARNSTPRVNGVDTTTWALDEAAWNWRHFGVRGRTRRGDLLEAAERLATSGDAEHTGIVLAWAVNEIPRAAHTSLLDALLAAAARGATVLVVEPIGGHATPWWPGWRTAVTGAGGRADEWRFDEPLPPALADVRDAAGFSAERTAKSLILTR